MVAGSCLCRDVAWESSGGFAKMGHCHCSMCRKAHGSAFATYAATPERGFRWVRGHERVSRYESSPGFVRKFCARCGSVVPMDPQPDGSIWVPMGCLDDDPGVRAEAHIFAADKAPWHEIRDALPRIAAYPEHWNAPEVTRPAPPESRAGAVRGSCLCGGATYELERELSLIVDCHCSRCRKAFSSAYGANLWAKTDQLRWLDGADLAESFDIPAANGFTVYFCRVCGAPLPPPAESDAHVVIAAGPLDGDPGARECMHIFTGSKAPWYEIADDLPQYEEDAPYVAGVPSVT